MPCFYLKYTGWNRMKQRLLKLIRPHFYLDNIVLESSLKATVMCYFYLLILSNFVHFLLSLCFHFCHFNILILFISCLLFGMCMCVVKFKSWLLGIRHH